MKISHQDYGPVTVLTLSGEFTEEDAERFARSCAERLSSGARNIVLHCEHLEFIDSAGLESWLRLKDQVSERRGQVRLVQPDATVTQILRLTRLDAAFQAHDSLESAVRSLR